MVFVWEALNGRSGHEAGRSLLCRLYAAETGLPLPEIAVTSRGKPYFPGAPYFFSVSHTRTHAFCCLSRHPVGIDAEPVGRKINARLASRYLSPAEQLQLAAAHNAHDCLLRLWVLKESYAKHTGRGWGNYLRETEFDPNDPRIQIIDGHYVAILEEDNHAV